MRTLIFSPLYLANPPQADVLQTWLEWQQLRNPDCDILLIDNNSAPNFLALVPALQDVQRIMIEEEAALPPLQKGINLVSFPDYIGTLPTTGRDGWGRAMCVAVKTAIDQDFDCLASVAYDVLSPMGIVETTGLLKQFNIGCIAPLRNVPFVMETGFCLITTAHLKQQQFLEKYKWRNWPMTYRTELICEQILQPFYKNWFVVTDELSTVVPEQLRSVQTIARAHNMKLYQAFMRHYVPDWELPSARLR